MAKVTDVEKLILLYVYGPLSFQDRMPENIVLLTLSPRRKQKYHVQCCALLLSRAYGACLKPTCDILE